MRNLVVAGLLALAAVILVLAAGFVAWRGPFQAAVAKVRGVEILVDSPSKSVGLLHVGEEKTVAFRLRNISGHPVRVVVGVTQCGCLVLKTSFPVIIGPGAEESVELTVAPFEPEPDFHQELLLYTTASRQAEINLYVVGTTAPARAEHAAR